MIPVVSAVVPTMGLSPLLVPCLEALRRDGGQGLEVVLVHQGTSSGELQIPSGLVDQLIRLPENRGFASATNLGISASQGRWVAVVNDDLVIEPGWLFALEEVLVGDERAAAAQGWNLQERKAHCIDGGGITWSRSWQALQIGHDEPASDASESGDPREIFGVSATAALYRRQALEEVALRRPPSGMAGGAAGEQEAGPAYFDPALVSYYEDVDLACRLRAAGWRCWRVPEARARHRGSHTGRQLGARRLALLYGNRYAVVARLLGGRFWIRLPTLALRDLKDWSRALFARSWEEVLGIPAGWLRALRLLPRFARWGRTAPALAEIERFRSQKGSR